MTALLRPPTLAALRAVFLLATLAASAAGAAPDEAAAPVRSWTFTVSLDGRPIGIHRYALSGQAPERTLVAHAEFAVRFLGLVVYRYRLDETERWEGDCVQRLQSTSTDGGRSDHVEAERAGERLRIRAAQGGESSAEGCLMTYAYWNPALREQSRLINPQTGSVDAVRIEREGAGEVDVQGRAVAAQRWRVQTPKGPVDLWYSPAGDWLGLDATVDGRHLSYRLA